MVIFTTLFRCCPTLWNSTLKMKASNVVHFNFEIHNVDSMLFDVVNSNVEKQNLVSTLIWRCLMLRRRINQKTTLNNVEMFAGSDFVIIWFMSYFQILMLGWNAPACGTFLDSFERLILRVPLVFFPRFFFLIFFLL